VEKRRRENGDKDMLPAEGIQNLFYTTQPIGGVDWSGAGGRSKGGCPNRDTSLHAGWKVTDFLWDEDHTALDEERGKDREDIVWRKESEERAEINVIE